MLGNTNQLKIVTILKIHTAIFEVLKYHEEGKKVFVFFEDAVLAGVTYHPNNIDVAKLQGVGSVKRDSKIWEEFLVDYHIPYKKVRPIKSNIKWSAKYFKKITGFNGVTNSHSRDAGVLALMHPPSDKKYDLIIGVDPGVQTGFAVREILN